MRAMRRTPRLSSPDGRCPLAAAGDARRRSSGLARLVWFVWLVVGISSLAGACAKRAPEEIPAVFQSPIVGSRAPDLAIRRWIVGPPPRPLAERGVPRLLLFWNYDDPASSEALEFADSIARAVPPEALSVVTIHTEIGLGEFQSRERLERFIAERRVTLPTALDEGNESLGRCRMPDVPSLLFVDRKGVVRGAMQNYMQSYNPQIADFIRRTLLER